MEKKGAGKFHSYNTEMDFNYGKRDLDPDSRARLKLKNDNKDLFDMQCIYIWGEPGSGKSFLADLLYASLDLGDRKDKMHYNEFMLNIHQTEHKVNKRLRGRVGETIAIVGNEFSVGKTFFFIDEF